MSSSTNSRQSFELAMEAPALEGEIMPKETHTTVHFNMKFKVKMNQDQGEISDGIGRL